jgi:hypothetical protein
MPTKVEKERYKKLARIGCILCLHLERGYTEPQMHHIRKYGGKRDNAPTIPLCFNHHTGGEGVHYMGRKRFESHFQITQEELLEMTEKLLASA